MWPFLYYLKERQESGSLQQEYFLANLLEGTHKKNMISRHPTKTPKVGCFQNSEKFWLALGDKYAVIIDTSG